MKSIVVAGLLALLAATTCNAGVKKQTELVEASMKALEAAPICCQDYSGLSYQAIEPSKHVKYMHDKTLQAMPIEGSKSFVKAVKLPPAGTFSTLWVEARVSGASMFVTSNVIVYPSVLFLDENHQVISRHAQLDYQFTSPWTSSDGMEAVLPLTSGERSARYLLIYTEPSNDGGRLNFCRNGPGVVVVGKIAVPAGMGEQCFEVPFAREGKVGFKLN